MLVASNRLNNLSPKFVPNSKNIPILNDIEFEAVGKKYKENGQEAAIDLGVKIVSDKLKEKRISKWKKHISLNEGCSIFCFRGGLRSKIAQEWLSENNIIVERINGGYKKVRNKIELSESIPTKCSSDGLNDLKNIEKRKKSEKSPLHFSETVIEYIYQMEN